MAVSPPFQPFSVPHFAALATGFAAIAFLILAGRKNPRGRTLATGLLAFLNLAVYPLSQAAWLNVPERGLENILPLHLCDIAAIVAGFALLTRNRTLCDLTYFWGLAATIQGLVTPAIQIGYPSLPFVMFFVHHFSVVAAALYLPLVEGWRPQSPWWRSPVRALLWAEVYLAAAMVINRPLGTNFGFAAHKPVNPSLLDHLGPWPWYLLSLQAVALLLFFLLGLPFLRRRRDAK